MKKEATSDREIPAREVAKGHPSQQEHSSKKEYSSKQECNSPGKKITRKEAISRTGKYAAFTAASMMAILNPVKAQPYNSPELPPEWFY